MNEMNNTAPQAYGEVVPEEHIAHVFKHVLAGTTDLVLYDGSLDYDSRVLSFKSGKDSRIVLIIDDTVPPLRKSILGGEITLVGRAQYFQSGLHHRVSFQTRVLQQAIYVGHNALWMNLLPPMKRVSNLYVSMPSENRPVLLEIPVAGAPPQVRVIEVSSSKLKVYAPEAKRLFPEAAEIKGMNLQLVDIGKAQINGIMRSISTNQMEVDITQIEGESQDLLDEYLKRDFLRTEKRAHQSSKWNAELESPPTSTPAVQTKEKTALVLIDKPSVRDRYVQILQGMGFQVTQEGRFEKVSPEMIRGRSLLVMDARQAPTHAESWIETWLQDGLIEPCRFILVNDETIPEQREKWPKLGVGLSMRSSYPGEWISSRIERWMKESTDVARPAQRKERQPEVEQAANFVADDIRILCVDDDLDMQDVIKDILEREGFQIFTASDGKEAIRLARNNPYDLILLDLHMPQYDGISTLQTLRRFSVTKHIPVIVVSGYYQDSQASQITDLGISAFIPKPFRPEELVMKTNRVLRTKAFDDKRRAERGSY